MHSRNQNTRKSPSMRQFYHLAKLFVFTYGIASVSAFTPNRLLNCNQYHTNNDMYLTYKKPMIVNSIHDRLTPKSNISNKNTNNKHPSLHMSSINQDNNNDKLLSKLKTFLFSKIPPPPENQISFIGDMSSIFLWTILDHAVNGMYDEYLNSPEVLVSHSASAAIESSFAVVSDMTNVFTPTPSTGNSFPVWFDMTSTAPFGNIPLSSALPITHHIHYAPAIDSTGMAAVLFGTTWMVCGYFTGAFKYKNTLECSPSRAILVTALNWFCTCVIMLSIAYSSDLLIGEIDALHKSVGLTRADVDYILESLSALLVWRYTLNLILGYGKR